MPQFAILRTIDPTITRDEMDAAAVETLVSLHAFDVDPADSWDPRKRGIQWVRTYWHEGSTWATCLYVAPDAPALKLYHDLCAVEFTRFDPIVEFLSPQHTDPSTGATRLDGDESLLTVEVQPRPEVTVDPDWFEDISNLAGPFLNAQVEGTQQSFGWARSYWDESRRAALALYAGRSPETVAELEAAVEDAGVTVRPVTEITPGDYIDR